MPAPKKVIARTKAWNATADGGSFLPAATCAKILTALEKIDDVGFRPKLLNITGSEEAADDWLNGYEDLKLLLRTASDGGFLGMS